VTPPVTILGAGVAGLTTAWELTQRGLDVSLVDPNGAAGVHGCSWWAGGMLAPICESEVAEEPVVRLGALAAEWWARAGVEVVRKGSLVLALDRDQRELDRFARRIDGGVMLDAAGVAELEPGLEARFSRGLFVAEEGHLDPRAALASLQTGLAAKGVVVSQDAPTAGQVIDCRGLIARDHLADLRGVRGEMVVLRAPDVSLSRPVRLLHPRHPLYVVPRGDGVFMLGATQIESEGRGPASLRSVVELLSAAYALDPAFGEAEVLEIGCPVSAVAVSGSM